MSESRVRRVRMALRLGGEKRATEIQIEVGSIPDVWELQPDGTYAHAALRALAVAWALDQLEVRAYTHDGEQPHFFHLNTPADNRERAVRSAAEHTWTPETEPEPRKVCDRCRDTLTETREPWESVADAWRHGGDDG